MWRECYLSAKFLLGVHATGSSEGIIKQDESITLCIESQVRTKGDKITGFLSIGLFLKPGLFKDRDYEPSLRQSMIKFAPSPLFVYLLIFA